MSAGGKNVRMSKATKGEKCLRKFPERISSIKKRKSENGRKWKEEDILKHGKRKWGRKRERGNERERERERDERKDKGKERPK